MFDEVKSESKIVKGFSSQLKNLNVETRAILLQFLTGEMMTSDFAVKTFLALDLEIQQEAKSIITRTHSVDKEKTSYTFESVLLRALTKDNWSVEDRQKLQAIQH